MEKTDIVRYHIEGSWDTYEDGEFVKFADVEEYAKQYHEKRKPLCSNIRVIIDGREVIPSAVVEMDTPKTLYKVHITTPKD